MIVFRAFVVYSGNGADTLNATTISQKLVDAEMIVYPKQENNSVVHGQCAAVYVS